MGNNEMENLIGPRSEDRTEKPGEDTSSDGQPLWMIFISPEAIHISTEEVQDAKNALAVAQTEKPEVIKMCKHKTINECRETIHSIAA